MLWPHQAYALEELERAISEGETRICITSPTGGGKSLILLKDLERRNSATIYTNRRMLMTQLGKDLTRAGIEHGVRASGHKPALLAAVQLAMIQTEASRVLKGKRQIHRCELAYIDEVHHNSADQMQALLEGHRKVRQDFIHIGITATPLGIGHLCDRLIVAGTNSALRDCGALVPAFHFGPNEPDTKWVGKVLIGEGECGLPQNKRMEFAHRVFGSVLENYETHNPQHLPALLFAPGVKESLWFAQELCERGIPSAHIDGQGIWVDGEEQDNSESLREEIADRHRDGDIKIVCNRFVLREGINWPWVCHGIFATVFGSLTSYIQAGGRLLRAHPGKDHCVIQDHGGCWWRHGSLNSDRTWSLEDNDRIVSGVREAQIRERKEPEPIVCPKCHAVRISGPSCWKCGHRHDSKSRPVLQRDGTLREMRGDIFRKRRTMTATEQITRDWCARIKAIKNSKKSTVKRMTFAQAEVAFARDHNWQFPPRSLPMMPVHDRDWFMPVAEVPITNLS